MSDTFTVTTSTSWFARLRNAVGAVVIGLVLVVGMVVLLFWNEGRAVTTARSLAEGAGAVVSVAADKVDPANEGKLVHVSGTVTTNSTPSDPDFAISATGVRLVRNVEMYQWKEESRSETTKKLGGGEETTTTYTYSKTWDDEALDSGSFKQPNGHQNPSMEIRGRSFQIPEAKLSAFTLDQPVLDQIGGNEVLTVKPDQSAEIEAAYSGDKKLSIVDGRIYLGWNPSSPAIGDYRVSYELVPLGGISVIGQQQGQKFQHYQTIAGDQLLMVSLGNIPATQMFKEAEDANKLMTWIIRAVGLVLLGVGICAVHEPARRHRRRHSVHRQHRQAGNRDRLLLPRHRRRHHHDRHRLVLLSAASRHRHSRRRRGGRIRHHPSRTFARRPSSRCRHPHRLRLRRQPERLLHDEERLDLACRSSQQRQDLALHRGDGEAAGLRRDVDRRDDRCRPVADRHGDRAQADLQFLVDHGEALRRGIADQALKQGPVGDRLFRQPPDRSARRGRLRAGRQPDPTAGRGPSRCTRPAAACRHAARRS